MAFDLGAMLKDVSNLDTGREQIEYIHLDLLDGDGKNFYELSEIEALANNIATIGLQQPLRLRKHPEEEGRYMVVSGHRRRAALQLLVQEDPERWSEVPCIVDRDTVSPALQQLRLIFGNANTRKMSSSDLSEQAAQVEKLLYQLKEEGYDFPGRMRDHVAQVVQVSKTKLARLKMIRDNLAPCWQGPYKHNKLVEDTAYSLAQLPVDWQQSIFDYFGESRSFNSANVKIYRDRFQKIDKLKCRTEGRERLCQNAAMKREKAIAANSWSSFNCGGCCGSCPDLASCKYACPAMSDRVNQLRADNRAARKREIAAQKEADRPAIEQITELWQRFGLERELSGKSVETIKHTMGAYFFPDDAEKYEKLESGSAKITTGTKLPYLLYRQDVLRLRAVADLFGCSIDYLLCRTDVREVAQEGSSGKVSESGTGEQPGVIPGVWYPSSVEPPVDVEIITVDRYEYVESCFYLGAGMLNNAVCTEWKDVVLWSLMPEKANTTERLGAPAEGWVPLEWLPGREIPHKQLRALVKFDMEDGYPPVEVTAYWRGRNWQHKDGTVITGQCICWFPLPPVANTDNLSGASAKVCSDATPPPLNNSCKTGMSPSGHCGSAAVCEGSVDCCLNCDKDCNLRCGWMEDIEHGISVSDN